MSQGPSETNRMRKIAASFKGKLSSLLHLSRAPTGTPSSIEMASVSSLNMVPVFATEGNTLTSDPPISKPVSGSIPVLKQLAGRGLEIPPNPPTHMSLTTHSPLLPSPNGIMQLQNSGSGIFGNPQNILITGGTFVNNILPADTTSEGHIKIPSPPNHSPVPVTLGTIRSGKKHSICSAALKNDRYITCEDNEQTVTSRGFRNGYGRRWFIRHIDNDNWIIESTRYNVFLSINDKGRVRASSHRDKWRIETTGKRGKFRIYNQERYSGRRLLSLNNDTEGKEIWLKKYDGGIDEVWEVEQF